MKISTVARFQSQAINGGSTCFTSSIVHSTVGWFDSLLLEVTGTTPLHTKRHWSNTWHRCCALIS